MMTHIKKNQFFVILLCSAIVSAIVTYSSNYFLKRKNEKVTGVWLVDAVGAPFQPHIATFHSDNTMEIHNPEAGDPHTSDSMGMGPWKIVFSKNNSTIITGQFVELNASRETNKYVNKLVVTYELTLSNNTFTGPAQAIYYNADETIHSGPFAVTLRGKKLLLPQKEASK